MKKKTAGVSNFYVISFSCLVPITHLTRNFFREVHPSTNWKDLHRFKVNSCNMPFSVPSNETTLIIIILRRKYFITWGKMKIDANRLFSNSVFAMWRSLRGTKYYIYTPRYIWRTYFRMPDMVVMINGFTIHGENQQKWFQSVFFQIHTNVKSIFSLLKEYHNDIIMIIFRY